MKICKNVHVYGIERIIFDKTTEYSLVGKTEKDTGNWERVTSPRNKSTERDPISNQQMAKNVTSICNTKEYKMEFNGNTAHVTTLPKSKELLKKELKRAMRKEAEKALENAPEIPTVVFLMDCPRHGE